MVLGSVFLRLKWVADKYMLLRRLLIVLFFLPCVTLAVSMGPLNVNSHLNQPLNANIPLKDVDQNLGDTLHVSLASEQDFKRAGLVKTALIKKLRFHLQYDSESHQYFIKITSLESVNEPFVGFMLQLSWEHSRHVKKYILLLEPKGHNSTITEVKKPITKRIVSARTEVAKITNGVYGPTQHRESLWAIARTVQKGKSLSIQQIMLALAQYNPEAFLLHNVNGLMSGYYLKIPSLSQMKSTSRHEALLQIKIHNRHWRSQTRVKLDIKAHKIPPVKHPQGQHYKLPTAEIAEHVESTSSIAIVKKDTSAVQAATNIPVKTEQVAIISKAATPKIKVDTTPVVSNRLQPVTASQAPPQVETPTSMPESQKQINANGTTAADSSNKTTDDVTKPANENFDVEGAASPSSEINKPMDSSADETLQEQMQAAIKLNNEFKLRNQSLQQELLELKQEQALLSNELMDSKKVVQELQNKIAQLPPVQDKVKSETDLITVLVQNIWPLLGFAALIVALVFGFRFRKKKS